MTPVRRPKFPMLYSRLGLSLGQAEIYMGQPADRIRQWIADGLITKAKDGSIPRGEIARFQREHSNLLP